MNIKECSVYSSTISVSSLSHSVQESSKVKFGGFICSYA